MEGRRCDTLRACVCVIRTCIYIYIYIYVYVYVCVYIYIYLCVCSCSMLGRQIRPKVGSGLRRRRRSPHSVAATAEGEVSCCRTESERKCLTISCESATCLSMPPCQPPAFLSMHGPVRKMGIGFVTGSPQCKEVNSHKCLWNCWPASSVTLKQGHLLSYSCMEGSGTSRRRPCMGRENETCDRYQ